MPGPLLDKLQGNLMSGDTEQITLTATHLARWAKQSPDLAAQIAHKLDPAMHGRVMALAEYNDLDIPEERAIQLGEEKFRRDLADPAKRDKYFRPGDEKSEPMPMVYRPGYVWENGDWRPETPEERDNKIMLLSAEGEGGGGQESGGEGQPTPGGDKEPIEGKGPAPKIPAPKEGGGSAGKPDEPVRDEEGEIIPNWEAPIEATPELPIEMVSPVDNPVIRDDKEGHGQFGERRLVKTFRDPDGNIVNHYRKHIALDIRTETGDKIKSPVTGTVKRIGDPYGDGKMDIIWIDVKGGHEVGIYYVTPKGKDGKPIVKPGDKIKAGQIVGTAQDIAKYYKKPKMQNHLHLKIKKGGQFIDPTPWFDKWKK